MKPLTTTALAFIVLASCKTKEQKATELIDSATAYQLRASDQYVKGTGVEYTLALRHEDTAKVYEARSKRFIDSAKIYLNHEQIKLLTK